ncbi:uncharacterized protein LOC101888090 [Musca domestica]|uniref:Uncharacterized protein LOC101888090 n=1 Tax=Musca domestica TaxID=7370 RepID=A0A9J7CZM9_MUSDO|nr:uncharacterized protein LOC101888090 [Musca domestica]
MYHSSWIIFLKLCACVVLTIIAHGSCSSTNVPALKTQFHNRILKRRTRSLVFPKKASLLLTPVFSKAVLGGIPRGLIYSMEFDMYHPLPDTVEGWQPTILLNQIGKKQKLDGTPSKFPGNSDSDMDSKTVPQNDDGPSEAHHFVPVYDDVEYATSPWAYYNTSIAIDPSQLFSHPYIERSSEARSHFRQFHNFLSPRRRVKFPQNRAGERHQQFEEDDRRTLWHRNQNYRERRQIFDQLEKLGQLFQINMKSCIQRAMCEMTTQLPPFGESLMHDIMRIILTVPKPLNISSRNDDDDLDGYGREYTNANCALSFSASCPYPVLPFLIKGFNR